MGFQVATRRVFGAGGFQVVKPTVAVAGGGGGSGYLTAVDADSPASHWRFGEGSGTNADDRAGSADGTYTGGVTLGVTGALASDADTAIRLASGSSQYVDLPGRSVGTDASWECWFKTTATGVLFGALAGTSAKITMEVNPRFAAIATNDAGSNTFIDGPFGKDNGAWHHAVLTKAGLVFVLYCDGSQVATGTATGTFTMNSARWGALPNGASFFTGDLDEGAIYATTLNSTRVAAHNTAGTT